MKENRSVPQNYSSYTDTLNSAKQNWKTFFADRYLINYIEVALLNNQELKMMLQEIEMAKSEARIRKGEYLPFVNLNGASGIDKAGRYTSRGAADANSNITENQKVPENLSDYYGAAHLSWEIDVWKKLRSARKAALIRYLGTNEGKNFMVTQLISEIAESYYELQALDNQLEVLQKNIEIQSNALQIIILEKNSAKVTELAVKRFEAEVNKNKSLLYNIQQKIIETENHLNYLMGRYPQSIERNRLDISNTSPFELSVGIPMQLFSNRPDIRKAELELEANKLDCKVAQANFYPSLRLNARLGLNAFTPAFFAVLPESIIYSLVGDIFAPLINRNALKGQLAIANARQKQAVTRYEQTLLNAFIEVSNQWSRWNNLNKTYEYQLKQVDALTESITISSILFKSARADYMEVLLTQRDALESKFELIETRKEQYHAGILTYRALGGGWN